MKNQNIPFFAWEHDVYLWTGSCQDGEHPGLNGYPSPVSLEFHTLGLLSDAGGGRRLHAPRAQKKTAGDIPKPAVPSWGGTRMESPDGHQHFILLLTCAPTPTLCYTGSGALRSWQKPVSICSSGSLRFVLLFDGGTRYIALGNHPMKMQVTGRQTSWRNISRPETRTA